MREAEGREAEPTACVLDAQSIKTSASVPAAGQGSDAAKKIAGRKRHIGVDALGLLLALARDYETHTHRSEGMIRIARIGLMSRRLTRESIPDWRDT